MARALLFAGLVCLAFTVAGAASVTAEAETDAVTGRKLQGYWAWFPQAQGQSASNWAGNNGPAYQQAVNQGNQQQGYGNSAGNSNSQSFSFGPPDPAAGKGPGKEGKGRKLLGYWGWIPDQAQFQSASNKAGNNGPAFQQAVNQGNQQQGNGNWAGNSNSQSFSFGPPDPAAGKGPGKEGKGRKLLGYWGWIPDQAQWQSASNYAGNNGPAYQQAVNQANQQQGDHNVAVNGNSQSFSFGPNPPAGKGPGKEGKGRKLLGYWGWFPDQAQYQSATNYAGNNGPAYQQAVNQGNQQQGSWNSAGNFNSQSFQFPADPAPGKAGKAGKD